MRMLVHNIKAYSLNNLFEISHFKNFEPNKILSMTIGLDNVRNNGAANLFQTSQSLIVGLAS